MDYDKTSEKSRTQIISYISVYRMLLVKPTIIINSSGLFLSYWAESMTEDGQPVVFPLFQGQNGAGVSKPPVSTYETV